MHGSGQGGTSARISEIGLPGVAASTTHEAFELSGLTAVPDVSGALYLPSERLLVVADLHLEKGSACARRRSLLPPYDTAATLACLASVLPRYAPRRVVALGDSFHDEWAAERLQPVDRAALRALQTGRDWLWIAGNHDRRPPRECGGEALSRLQIGDLVLRHLPGDGSTPEIAGHLHPAARVASRSGSVRRRCFVADRRRCVMPAFGAYAGGLNMRDRAFAGLFDSKATTAHVLGRHRVHAVPVRHCLPDR